MSKIKIISDKIIIDGHANSRDECETLTLLANLLSTQGSGFNAIEYRSGYAEFRKSDVIKLRDNELMFEPDSNNLTINFDSNIVKVVGKSMAKDQTADIEWTASGQTNEVWTRAYTGTPYTFEVTFSGNYIIDAVSIDGAYDNTVSSKTDSSFIIPTSAGGIGGTITLTSKVAAFDGEISITKPLGIVLKTANKYCDKDIKVVPELEAKTVTPTTAAQTVKPSDGKAGLSEVTVNGVSLQSKSVTAGTSSTTVTPDSSYVGLSSVTVAPTPSESKTVSPTTSSQTITPSSGKLLSQVTVSGIQIETKTATPGASAQTITPTSGKYLASVTVSAVPSQTKSATPAKEQ